MRILPFPVTALWGQTMRSLGFLGRVPLPQRYFTEGEKDRTDMPRDSAAFPLAGALLAVPPALVLLVLSVFGVPDPMAATFAILAMVAMTGALHEDGLADVADGFGGGHDRERRLEIMKDSRIGAFGAIAIAGALLLRVAGLSAVLSLHGAFAGALVMIAVAACSRAAIVWFWASMPNARGDGIAADAGAPGESAVSAAAILGLAIFAVLGLVAAGFLNTAIALLLALAAMQLFSRLCRRMIGGHTGDTLGACQQIVEITLLTGLALGA